jgi:mono/diheme cytochrome c family protein
VHVAEDALGARIYEGACASCHRPDGTGTETPMAALAGDQTAMDPQGTNLVRVLTTGGAVTTSLGSFAMPGFARGYTDTELAAVANYTIEHFGQRVGRVTPGVVAALRSQTSTGPAAGRGAGS